MKKTFYSCVEKPVPVLCLWFLGVLPKIPFSVFAYQKISRILGGYLRRPLSGVGEIEKLLPISIKYTKLYYFWALLDTKQPIVQYKFLDTQ